jgi:enoyl-[acyl-carrier-protein] reductase (NADH)
MSRLVETGRASFLLAQDVGASSLAVVTRAKAPLMTEGGSLITSTYLAPRAWSATTT